MKFDIAVLNKQGSLVYITEFDPLEQQHNLYSTFDEKLSCQDNSQTTLTFSISKFVPDESGRLVENPLLKYLKFGTQLILDTVLETYNLVITQIQPQLKKLNVIYNFTCQDEVSYKWPRIKLGYSYNSMERGGVATLYTIAAQILSDCGLDTFWSIKDNNSHMYPNTALKTEKITLQVEGSNPYNAIIEALNTLNASMLINYRTHEIRFYQKDKVMFSGYRYRPETNLRSMSADYNIDELATILHVTGGTDEKDINVMLVPPIPTAVNNYLKAVNYVLPSGGYPAIPAQDAFAYTMYTTETSGVAYEAYQKEIADVRNFCTIADKVPSLGQFLYNFDFFKQNGTMSLDDYNEIKNIFDVEMRNNNIKLKPLTVTYYNTMWEMKKALTDIESILEQMNAAYMGVIKNSRAPQGAIDVATLLSDVDKYQQQVATNFAASVKDYYITLYDDSRVLKNSTWVPELQEIQSQALNYIKIRNDAKYYYYHLQDQYYVTYGTFYDVNNTDTNTEADVDRATLEADIAYYYDRFYMALQMCGLANTFNEVYTNSNPNAYYWYNKEYLPVKTMGEETNPANIPVPVVTNNLTDGGRASSYYYILLSVWFNNIGTKSNPNGLYYIIQSLEQINKSLWNRLYTTYSQFIYEATYENADELDSVSLYNQAVAYFENYHHPKSSYSVEIINLEDLEQIGVPNLRVNSRIRVYNENLNLNDGDNLNNISYTPNELTITGLDYDLRKSATMSITVETVVQHQNILQKLIKNLK